MNTTVKSDKIFTADLSVRVDEFLKDSGPIQEYLANTARDLHTFKKDTAVLDAKIIEVEIVIETLKKALIVAKTNEESKNSEPE